MLKINEGAGCFPNRRSMDNLFKDLEEILPELPKLKIITGFPFLENISGIASLAQDKQFEHFIQPLSVFSLYRAHKRLHCRNGICGEAVFQKTTGDRSVAAAKAP